MEKFGQDRYTTNFSEVHPSVLETLETELALTVDKNNFVSATWIENMFTKGEMFCAVLKDRIVYKFAEIAQNYFSSITGIEKIADTIYIHSAGNKIKLFDIYSVKKDVSKLIFTDINRAFNEYQNAKDEATAKESPDELIRKFHALYQEGILTEEEFTAKKKQILENM